MIQLNDRITLKNNVPGVVRYIGPVEGRDEEWVGIELDEPKGSNNGCINSRRYFSCPERHGLFVKYRRLTQRMSAVDTPYGTAGNTTLHSSEPLECRAEDEAGQGEKETSATACPGNSCRDSLFPHMDGDGHYLREQSERYKQIAFLILEKSAAALSSIQSSLDEVQSRIGKLRIRKRTEAERDRVVQLVSRIYHAEKSGGFARDAYGEFKEIMRMHGISVD